MAKKDDTALIRRQREIYEEEASMFIAILLEQKRKFLVSERIGSGTSEDPYIRKIEYYANKIDEKNIDKYIYQLSFVARKRD